MFNTQKIEAFKTRLENGKEYLAVGVAVLTIASFVNKRIGTEPDANSEEENNS